MLSDCFAHSTSNCTLFLLRREWNAFTFFQHFNWISKETHKVGFFSRCFCFLIMWRSRLAALPAAVIYACMSEVLWMYSSFAQHNPTQHWLDRLAMNNKRERKKCWLMILWELFSCLHRLKVLWWWLENRLRHFEVNTCAAHCSRLEATNSSNSEINHLN